MDAQIGIEQQAHCPRCGYDQRGVVATWIEQCPLEGVCTECGLRIIWAEVLHPVRFEPQWCVEFVPRARRVPRACLSTFVRSFWPWGFWSRLKMSQPIRPVRLWLYVAFLVCSPLLCYVPIQAGVAIYVRSQIGARLSRQLAQIPAMNQAMQRALQSMQSTPSTDPQVAAQQQQQMAIMQQNIARNQRILASPPRIDCSYVRAILEAVFLPLESDSSGTMTSLVGSGSYVAPASLWDAAVNISSYTRATGGVSGGSFDVPIIALFGWLAFGLTLMLLLPGSFLFLPVSRRRAKVRWSHIGRVTLYGMFVPVSAVFACAGLFAMSLLLEDSSDAIHKWMIFVISAGMPIALTLWWGAAIGRYMKISHGYFTAIVLMILCALLLLAGIWVTVPGVLINS